MNEVRGFPSKRILAVLVTALAVALLAQTGVSFAQASKAEKPVVQKAAPLKLEKELVKKAELAAPPLKPAISPTTEVEIQRRFNELRSELLENRESRIEWWMGVMGIALTFFGVVVGIGGFFGVRIFREIVADARESAKEAKQIVADAQKSAEAADQVATDARKSAEDAKELVEEIKGYRDESEEVLGKINAQVVANDPEKVRQVTEDVRNNPRASLLSRAIVKAFSLQRQGKKEEAIEKWRGIANVVEENDKNLAARAWFSIGYLLDEQGEYEEAINAYSRSIDLSPNDATAYSNRGVVKSARLSQYDNAISDYNKAIQIRPDYSLAYLNRGVARIEMGQYEAAIVDCRNAILLEPDNVLAYYNLGGAKARLGRKDEAREDLMTALNLARAANDRNLVNEVESGLRDLDNQRDT